MLIPDFDKSCRAYNALWGLIIHEKILTWDYKTPGKFLAWLLIPGKISSLAVNPNKPQGRI